MTDLDTSGWAFDGEGRLYDLNGPAEVEVYGPPPAPTWVSPVDLPAVFGLRCALAGRTRTTYDLRCASDVFESNGGQYVNVVDEAQWYRWLEIPPDRRPGRIPRASCIGARHLWVETHDQTWRGTYPGPQAGWPR